MRRIIPALALCLLAAGAFPATIDLEAKAGGSTETPSAAWGNFSGGFDMASGDLRFLGHLALRSDGYYGGFMSGSSGFGAPAFEVADGGMIYSGESLAASLGKLEMRDIVDSPYSLFVSGRGNKALGASFAFQGSGFFYTNRWIALNYDLKSEGSLKSGDPQIAWPDRSAVVKSWGLNLGSFRFALQDVVIYTSLDDLANGVKDSRGPLFDLDYFLLPIPSVIVQYIGFSEDGPWAKTKRNDNSISGFMLDWKGEGWYAVGQILVDDINLNRYLNPSGRQNPDKIAWHLGARHETDIGTFGLYHAGATKYTFEPYGNSTENSMYGYTFYPDSQYEVDHSPLALEPEANYVGYVHGENNLALMGTWRNSYGSVAAAASLEATVSGSKSPVNPWHEYLSWKDGSPGTKLLDEDRLETKIVAAGSASLPHGGFDLGVEIKLGYVWNRLELAAAGDAYRLNGLRIYKPSRDSAPIGELVLGARYHVPL